MPKIGFLIFCLMFFTVSFGVSAMAALTPSIALYFGIPQESAFRLTWLYMLPYGVFALFWAPLTRIVRVKKLFLITTIGFCLCSLLFSLSASIRQAFVFRFLVGCFGCSFVPLALITIGKTVTAEHKAKHVGTFFAVSYVSTLVSVFLSGFLHWRIIYLIPSVLGLAVFFLILFFLNDLDFRKQKFEITYIATLRDKQAINFFIVVILGSFLYHSLQQRLGIYLSETYSLRQAAISLIFTVAILSAVLFEFMGGFLSSRFGNIKVVRAGFILMSLFVMSLLVIKKYQLMFMAITFWGGGWALTHVGLSSYLANFSGKTLRDASSLNSALRFSFGGLGAFVGGLLVSCAGFKALFAAAALAICLLGLYSNKIIYRRKESYG